MTSPFATLTVEYFRGYFAFRPTEATWIGIHDHDERLGDRSAGAVAAEVARLRTFEERLGGIDVAALGDLERRDHAILTSHIGAEIFRWEVLRPHVRDPMSYNDSISWGIDELVSKKSAPPEVRLRRVIARESDVSRLLASARANLDRPPRVYTEKAIELVGGTIEYLETTLPAAFAGVGDEALQATFRERNAATIAEVREFRRFLEADLLPRSDGEFALGAERFATFLRLHEMVDIPLDRLEAIGLEHLAVARDRFFETALRIDPDATPSEVLESLQEDHASAEELLSSTAESLEGMRQFLIDAEIVTLPSEERCRVVPMPPYMWGFAAMNSPGPLETVAKEAYYYVDPVEDDWPEEKKEEHLRNFNRPAMDVISIHEAYPGHYVQGLYVNEAPSLVRKALWTVTHGEGWAHYTEQMMLDEGYGDGDPRLRLAQLGEALLRLCRYRVAIGLHTQGWTVDQATRFFVEEGWVLPEAARREAVRGTFDPLYLGYTLGKLQILKLREDYREKMGAGYRLKDFHDRFLREGTAPIRIIREALLGPGSGDDL